jgi:hypothetical protein
VADLRPLPPSTLTVVQHRDRLPRPSRVDRRPLLTVHLPIGLELHRELVALVRRHHPDVVVDGLGDVELVLVEEVDGA